LSLGFTSSGRLIGPNFDLSLAGVATRGCVFKLQWRNLLQSFFLPINFFFLGYCPLYSSHAFEAIAVTHLTVTIAGAFIDEDLLAYAALATLHELFNRREITQTNQLLVIPRAFQFNNATAIKLFVPVIKRTPHVVLCL
jgi:hypothetical protein